MENYNTLPEDGFIRINELIKIIPLGRSTIWLWVKQGRFPAPIKWGSKVTVWRNKDINKWRE